MAYHCFPLELWAIDHHPLDMTIPPIPYPPKCPSTKSISFQFRGKSVVRDHVEDLTEAQIDDTCSHSLVHWCSLSIIEGHWFGQSRLFPGEAVLSVPNHLLVLHVSQHSFHRSLSHYLPRHRDAANTLIVSNVLLSTLFRNGRNTFPFSNLQGLHPIAMDFQISLKMACSCIRKFPQDSGMYHIQSHRFMYIQFPKVMKKHCRFQSWRRIHMRVTDLARKDAKRCIKM